ncbi:APC family permease [Streptomyces sp. NPDC058469]|uniref:APC family permease n=1 Tax=Streptomyces sp. NPDC058469 TaxID=3346514 RepID=UPI00365D5FD1
MARTKPQSESGPRCSPAEPVLDTEGMPRDVGFLGLLWTSEASIIGSGWLFGALTATGIAGPSALISWVIGTLIILLLALVHAELGSLFPVSGGTSRFPHYAFGSLAGATFGWFTYLQAAATAPIEVLAAIQYASTYKPLARWHLYENGALSGWGIALAVVLMLFFTVVNLIGISFLSRVNSSLTFLKVLLPVLAMIVLAVGHFHSGNFTAGGGFFVPGAALKSIVVAVPGAVVFSLIGFEQAVQIGGESKNPKKDLPRAVIASILLGSAIYIGVQIAFIGALDPALLAHGRTWGGLVDPTTTNPALTALQGAPFYEVATLAGVGWLAALLRLDAVVSPSGTGLIYLTTTSRVSFSLSKGGHLPSAFEKLSGRRSVPVFGIIVSTVIGLLFLLPFPSWGSLVSTVASASVLMYAGAPLALGALRSQKPDLPRAYRLPVARVLAPLAFVMANFIVMWSGWGTYTTLMLALLIGYALMAVSAALGLNSDRVPLDWSAAVWLFPYLVGLGVIIYFTQYGPGAVLQGVGVFEGLWVGGQGGLGLGWDMLAMAAFSLAIYYTAMTRKLPSEQVDQNVQDVYPLPLDA